VETPRPNAKLCVLVDYARFGAKAEGLVLHGYQRELVESKLKRAGFTDQDYEFESLGSPPYAKSEEIESALSRINSRGYRAILALGDQPLKVTTDRSGIRKWHLSPLEAITGLVPRMVMPSYHPESIMKEPKLGFYLELATKKLARHIDSGQWPKPEQNFRLNPPLDEALQILRDIRHQPWLALDIETGYGQINTFGVAWSPSDSLAIKTLPSEYGPDEHYELWREINQLCSGPAAKIMQNGLYERMFLARYGIHIENFAHDTMLAMRLLWPEFEKGLDNVGRIHTMLPYWKDMGRVVTAESSTKAWGNIRDWDKHLLYNALDTSGTFQGATDQRKHLEARDLLEFFDHYVMRLTEPTYEMSMRGLPINRETQAKLTAEYEAKVTELESELSIKFNIKSSQQKLKFLQTKGFKLPKKRNIKTGGSRDTADELALKKLRLKHPNDRDLDILLESAKLNKTLSSYLRVGIHADDRVRYSLDPFATKTSRMACRKDPWDMGFNAQTMNKTIKRMIEWPESLDRWFVEIDLRQAESRFVAYDAAESTLLDMLERGEDVHRYVAAEIFQKPMSEIVHSERQLGKKSGHGANYSMGVSTFQESCLKEMNLVIDHRMAERVLEAYHRLFPGIRRWHQRIRSEVYNRRYLNNPLGFERYFYGRIDDNTLRDAYSWRPQSTIPMITNHLMFALAAARARGEIDFWFHNQVHDSVYLSAPHSHLERIAKLALDTARWHPEVKLPAGRLVIPTEVQVGKRLSEMTEFKIQPEGVQHARP